MDSSDQIETFLRSRRRPGLPDHFVIPHYNGYSVANIAPTIGHMLGVTIERAAPPLPKHLWTPLAQDVSCVVLLILDAVGYHQLRHHLEAGRSIFGDLAAAGSLAPITSVFPSTTVSALTSIWTGQPPLRHGFLGTRLLLPKLGVLANLLKMAPAAYLGGGRLRDWGWEPDSLVQVPSLASRLAASGVKTVAHTRLSFLGSNLTRIFLRGMDALRGYVGLSDLWLNLSQTLAEREPNEPLFVGAYWAGTDQIGHVYGPEGEYAPAALRQVARSLKEDFIDRLSSESRAGTVLIVTADHGQIATPPEKVVRLPLHPRLQETLLLPPAGESRAAYLYVRPGGEPDLRAYVKAHLAERFILWKTDSALEAGLWGPQGETPSGLRARLGDLLMLASDGSRLTTRKEKLPRGGLRGHHGSLTPDEMLVPLLMARLDRL